MLMDPPLLPTFFSHNPYRKEWFERDFIHSPDGVQEFPQHHCKLTFNTSLPFIRNFRVAVDVGCRDGEYARYLQHYFSDVICFDPRDRVLFPYNVDLTKTTHFMCALGDEQTEIEMYGGTHNPASGKNHIVACHTLDSFCLSGLDYLKIDVEGFERKVLAGGVETIERFRPVVVIEQNDVSLPDESPLAAKEWLEERGYFHAATCPRGWDHIMVPI